MCVGCLVVAFIHSWLVTAALLAYVPLCAGVLHLLGRRLGPAANVQRDELSRASKYASASLLAIDLVKVYNAQDHELWQYLQVLKQAGKQYLIQTFCVSSQMGFVKFWMVSLFVIGFWLGAFLDDKGETTPGNVLTTFYAVLIAFQSVESLGTQWLAVVKGMAAGKSLLATLGQFDGCQTEETSGLQRPERVPEDIELENVSIVARRYLLVPAPC